MLFTGKPELSIDAQQRLAIPAKVRANLDPEVDGEAFYIISGANGALWLWPERQFERMAGEIEPSLAPAPELMDFDELIFPAAQRLEMDSAGRIRIPEELLAQAGLGSRALLVGMRNHMEIWDPERWRVREAEKSARRAEILQRARPALGEQARDGKT